MFTEHDLDLSDKGQSSCYNHCEYYRSKEESTGRWSLTWIMSKNMQKRYLDFLKSW